MAIYINQPMFPVDFLRPKRASFDNPGSAVDGGVNGVGESISMETSGGGIITATYSEMVLEGPDERHEIINMLGARLNGGFRFINVPIVNDKIGAFPIIRGAMRPIIKGIPHSDGSLFSDESGYSQATVYGELTADAALNAGIISMRVYGAGRDVFRWSDWFSIYHEVKGWRAYRSWELLAMQDEVTETIPVTQTKDYLLTVLGSDAVESLLTATAGDALDYLLTSALAQTEIFTRTYRDYTLAISPPLRQAAVAGTRVELARPTCVMKIAKGQTIPWEYSGWYSSRPSISFTEAF